MDLKEIEFSKDYFDELLKRIKEIRASESRFNLKINAIYKECSCDYNSTDSMTRNFHANVQNKFHYAITGCTAAELILERANCTKVNMGLTTWKNSPEGNIRMDDTTIAKNYYTQDELERLHDIVAMYLDYAERQAKLHKPMYMAYWVNKLDEFLEFNEYEISGRPKRAISAYAKEYAKAEFKRFRKIMKIAE